MTFTADSIRPNSISFRTAIRDLYQRVKIEVLGSDPAPWFEVDPAEIEIWAEGDESAFIDRKKLQERTTLVMQRGILLGEIRAHFSDTNETHDIPCWAWEKAERNEHVWFEGRLPLDVFLPEEWRRWSNHSVFLDQESFENWMDDQDLSDAGTLPELPGPIDFALKPASDSFRPLPNIPYVALSEALSWIAFDFALDKHELYQAICTHAFEEIDPQSILASAMEGLAQKGSDGSIAFRGKYMPEPSAREKTVRTEPIDPVRLHDYAQFDILYDALRYGTGSTRIADGNTVEVMFQEGLLDSYHSVVVCRADILQYFPANNEPSCEPIPTSSAERAPSVKAGRSPDDDLIIKKADEMHARGITGYDIAKMMRHEKGFENAGNVWVRELIKGRYKSGGRPIKNDA